MLVPMNGQMILKTSKKRDRTDDEKTTVKLNPSR